MVIVENIINSLIQMDATALNRIKQIKEKEKNIENYISENLEKEKDKIDAMYLYKRKIIQEKFDKKLKEKKLALDEQKQKDIKKMQEEYSKNKSRILENLLKSIVN